MLKKKAKTQAVLIEMDKDFVKDVDKLRKRLGLTRKAFIVACIEQELAAQSKAV